MRKIDVMNEFNKPENRAKWNDQARIYLEDKGKLRKLVNEAMKKTEHKDSGPINYSGEKLQLLLHLAKDYAQDIYLEAPGDAMLLIVMWLAYFVSPEDLIADDLPSGLGLEDDAAILEYVIKQVVDDLEAYKDWKRQQ